MDDTVQRSIVIPAVDTSAFELALAVVEHLSSALGAVVETVDLDPSGEGEIVLRVPRGA